MYEAGAGALRALEIVAGLARAAIVVSWSEALVALAIASVAFRVSLVRVVIDRAVRKADQRAGLPEARDANAVLSLDFEPANASFAPRRIQTGLARLAAGRAHAVRSSVIPIVA